MIEAIDRLFKRLAATYGARWDASLGQTPIVDVKTVWAHELAPFAGQLHRIAWALENLPERCPNAIEFRNLCRQAPAPEAPRIDEPKADPERVKAELAKLAPLREAAASAHDHKAWARRILEDVKAGIKRSPAVVQMALNAVGVQA